MPNMPVAPPFPGCSSTVFDLSLADDQQDPVSMRVQEIEDGERNPYFIAKRFGMDTVTGITASQAFFNLIMQKGWYEGRLIYDCSRGLKVGVFIPSPPASSPSIFAAFIKTINWRALAAVCATITVMCPIAGVAGAKPVVIYILAGLIGATFSMCGVHIVRRRTK